MDLPIDRAETRKKRLRVAVVTETYPPEINGVARTVGVMVDALLGQQDIVVEPFDAPRGMPPYVGGATILADGTPALILDAAALI